MTQKNPWIFQDKVAALRILRTAGALVTIGNEFPDLLEHARVAVGILHRLPSRVEADDETLAWQRADELVRFGVAAIPLVCEPRNPREWAERAARDALMAAAIVGGYELAHMTEVELFECAWHVIERCFKHAIDSGLIVVEPEQWPVFATLLEDGFAVCDAAEAASLV